MKMPDEGLTPESAKNLVVHITDEAHLQCHLFYDIYMYLAQVKLHDVLSKLGEDDADMFRKAAALRGFNLNSESLEQYRRACFEPTDKTCKEYNEALAEIRRDQ